MINKIKFYEIRIFHELLYAVYSMIERPSNGTISWNLLRTFRCRRGQNWGKLDQLMLELCTLISEQFASLIKWRAWKDEFFISSSSWADSTVRKTEMWSALWSSWHWPYLYPLHRRKDFLWARSKSYSVGLFKELDISLEKKLGMEIMLFACSRILTFHPHSMRQSYQNTYPRRNSGNRSPRNKLVFVCWWVGTRELLR